MRLSTFPPTPSPQELPDGPSDGTSRDATPWIVLPVAAVLGVFLRVSPAGSAPFVVGDGGLFLQVTRDIAHAGQWPATSAYNHENLPVAYPPLGLALTALLHAVLRLPLLDIYRFLPPVVACLSLAAFAFLAHELLRPNTLAWVSACCVFACLPDGFYAETMGGGVTRSFGQGFALVALGCLARALRTRSTRWSAVAGFALGLAILSHPDWALFGVSSGVLMVVWQKPNGAALRRAALVAGAAIVVAAPWWLDVAVKHGVATLGAPLGNGAALFPWYQGLGNLVTLQLTEEGLFPLGTALALAGLAWCVSRRQFFLPIWLALTFLVEPRAGVSRAVVVVGLSAGVGASALATVLSNTGWGHPSARAGTVTLVMLTLYLAAAASVWSSDFSGGMSRGDVAAMQWAATHTAASSRFLVLADPASGFVLPAEWFPTLANRVAVDAPAVGYEWVPGAVLRHDLASRAAVRCASRTAACILNWTAAHRLRFQYLLVPSRLWRPGEPTARPTCCPLVVESLLRVRALRLVYNRLGDRIYRAP